MTLNIVSSFNGVSDPDAAAYIEAVEAADGELLEFAVGKAINDFVLGCKADGVWDAIKASCILAGARTTNGALVPLKGTAPTPYNFDLVGDTDYNRKTGLVGDGSTKYLDSNRNNNADPQNSQHLVVYVATTSGVGSYIGAGNASASGSTHFGNDFNSDIQFFRSRTSSSTLISGAAARTGFVGMSRSSSNSYDIRSLQSNNTASVTSQPPFNNTIYVFARGQVGAIFDYSPVRLAFYSIGESLDLALLDARVTDLITAFGAAIP